MNSLYKISSPSLSLLEISGPRAASWKKKRQLRNFWGKHFLKKDLPCDLVTILGFFHNCPLLRRRVLRLFAFSLGSRRGKKNGACNTYGNE